MQRLLKEAKSVEVLRLKGSAKNAYFTAKAADGEPNIAGFAIESRAPLENPALLQRLRTLALNPTAYEFYEGIKLCGGFQPKVAFRFCDDAACLDIMICFNCSDVGLSYGPPNPSEPLHYRSLSEMKVLEWWKLPKDIFPKDEFIQRQNPH